MIGRTISHYRIEEKLGQGGMGVVYRAVDTRLDRPVALKFLPEGSVLNPDRRWRFEREAKTASALNHPHIVTIYDIGESNGAGFIAMEYVPGRTLDRLIPEKGLPLGEALDWALQAAEALGTAHGAGIVHRDVKPSNILVSDSGQVKVLDFGLAKLLEDGEPEEAADSKLATKTSDDPAGPDRSPKTGRGTVLGTPAYMSPEQAQGKPLDARSDVFSFGAVLYEMLTGHRPFSGDSELTTLAAILRDPMPPLRAVRRDAPKELERILRRCLEKRPEARYSSAAELAAELKSLSDRRSGAAAASRPRLFIAAAAVLVALLAGAGYLIWRNGRVRWARDVAMPEIERLTRNDQVVAAFRLARRAERYAPAEVQRLRRDLWLAPRSIETIPSGAEVLINDYLTPDSPWENLGRSPIRDLQLPLGYSRWRIIKDGFQPIDAAGFLTRLPTFQLDAAASVPPGMVHVPARTFQLRSVAPVDLPDYWLDKYEVTNRRFKEFVDRGGYEKREYWKQPFVKDDRTLSWEEAMSEFRDATGRPGPATWSLGTYPENQEDYPVGGVSWYEAAAYAEFAEKRLPTVYHWYNAAGADTIFSDILRLSNLGGRGPARVGSYRGMSPYGSYDMAGNVREWCWNETGGKRYILGGLWNDPEYFFTETNAQPPFDRSAGNGFRCIRTSAPPAEALLRPIETVSRDFSKETPVSDDVFRIYRGFFAYDRTPLEARVESVDDSSPHWRREKVSFRAAYGNERVPAYLFQPRNAAPPYQTVVFFPSTSAQLTRSSDNLDLRFAEFVVRSGRALLFPVYKETYERLSPEATRGPNFRRDMVVAWSKDIGRSIDYLETRPDVDRSRLAYYGMSLGANDGVVLVALEERFRVAVLFAGGFRFGRYPPEIDMINFAPRVKIPVLLLGGSQDFQHPLETAQKPLFRLLGTPEKDKRHFVFEGGHVPPRMEAAIKEILDWLDRWLGPVNARR